MSFINHLGLNNIHVMLISSLNVNYDRRPQLSEKTLVLGRLAVGCNEIFLPLFELSDGLEDCLIAKIETFRTLACSELLINRFLSAEIFRFTGLGYQWATNRW